MFVLATSAVQARKLGVGVVLLFVSVATLPSQHTHDVALYGDCRCPSAQT